MNKLKVMSVVGTRPEIIKLSAVIKKLDDSPVIDHIFVHTGQNYDYELSGVFFRDFSLRKPDFFLDAAAGTAMETIGVMLIKIDAVLEQVKPDAFLVLGGTNSCLCSIAAKRRHIPIFHMEAGSRCFDQRVPEEINRRIVDQISDINLTYSDIARENLIREGFPADRIIKTGSPLYEVINSQREAIKRSDVLERLGLDERKYFVVSAHMEKNINSEENLLDLAGSLNAVAEKYKLPVIISTHPGTGNMMERMVIAFNPLISLVKPLGFIDYIRLQTGAKAVLSDSGTISEESSILNFPAINIRQTHERPEAMEEASVMMTGLFKERILQGLEILEAQDGSALRPVECYSVPNVSDKVLRIILSYTDYVGRAVWGNTY